MFLPTLTIIATVGLFAIRNKNLLNLYLITLSIIGGYLFVNQLSNLFFGL